VKIVYTVNDPLFFLSHRLPLAKNAINKNWQVFLVSDFSNIDIKEKFTLERMYLQTDQIYKQVLNL